METEKLLHDAIARLEGVAEQLKHAPLVPREYLKVEEAAEFMGLSKVQLDEWRSRNTGGPAWSKIGRRVVYAIADLRAFMASNRQEPLE